MSETVTNGTVVRSTSAQLRRAAGSQSLEKLKEALQGWTREEIDQMSSSSSSGGGGGGKNPVHMAAWQGSLKNLQYLVETRYCDINTIATGEYSYGKTPIFFAATATQSRNDIVEYLLDANAKVKIVNNKGQSVLSIASSHLQANVVTRIQQQEAEQTEYEWVNYRATHSDELEYGDLDPRFLERPLRETDVETPLAVNPTTKASRQGSFLKRNPHLTTDKRKKQPQRKKKAVRPALSEEEESELEKAWSRLLGGLERTSSQIADGEQIKDDVKTIIQLSDKRRQEWIPSASQRIKQNGLDPNEISRVLLSCKVSERETQLLEKLVAHVNGIQAPQSRGRNQAQKQNLNEGVGSCSFQKGQWKVAYEMVKAFSMKLFENGKPILNLPKPPFWVDSVKGLEELEQALCNEPVIGIDSEWCIDADRLPKISTLQIAIQGVHVWILDLLHTDPSYQTKACEVVRKLFASEKILMGFAIGHDIPKIEEWLQESHFLSRECILDLQILFGSRSQIPGLASCCAHYSTLPLSKEEQCSNWGHRHLTSSQLEYAGLDSAILFALLAERLSELED